MWFYIKNNLKKEGYFNKATYGLYGFLSPKNTIFFSNIELNLKYGKCPKKYEIKIIDNKEYYVIIDKPEIKIPATRGRSNFLSKSANCEKILRNKYDTGINNLDLISKISKAPIQKNKLDTKQICESGSASAIPYKLIEDIFKQFKEKLNESEN